MGKKKEYRAISSFWADLENKPLEGEEVIIPEKKYYTYDERIGAAEYNNLPDQYKNKFLLVTKETASAEGEISSDPQDFQDESIETIEDLVEKQTAGEGTQQQKVEETAKATKEATAKASGRKVNTEGKTATEIKADTTAADGGFPKVAPADAPMPQAEPEPPADQTKSLEPEDLK